ncbi:MAG TPA: CRISPR-associated protein Cas4 [Herpetosiphonaceae bacterium]
MIAYLLLACAVGLLVLALRLRRATGIPWTRIQTSDTSGWRRAEEPLVSQRYGLVGKPDYVLETRGGLIPVEVKPGRKATAPYESDLMQLAAYCLLIEDTTGRAPSYGLLRYAQQTFKLPYTEALRAELLELIEEMRQNRSAQDVARSHDSAARCRGCGFYADCDDRLEYH